MLVGAYTNKIGHSVLERCNGGKFGHTQGVLKRKSIHVAEFVFVVSSIGKTLGMARLP